MIKPEEVTGRRDLVRVRDMIAASTVPDEAVPLNQREDYREILARFYVNYSSYLVDIGNYYDAVSVLLLAQSITDDGDVRAETASHIASINARFLKAFDEAARHYQDILTNHGESPLYEVTLFHYGLLLQSKGEVEAANEFFARYLREFPQGRHSATIRELILKKPAAASPAQ